VLSSPLIERTTFGSFLLNEDRSRDLQPICFGSTNTNTMAKKKAAAKKAAPKKAAAKKPAAKKKAAAKKK